jgi:hypothetical protein
MDRLLRDEQRRKEAREKMDLQRQEREMREFQNNTYRPLLLTEQKF